MTWTAREDSFSGLYTILDGDRVVAENVGKGDAERIVEAVNEGEWYNDESPRWNSFKMGGPPPCEHCGGSDE